jgi:predicted S18 family serine protease
MTIEAMKQALEALENLQGLCSEEGNFIEQLTIWTPEAMYALRTAIAEAEKQEPVAWAVFEGWNAHDLYLPQEYDEALKMAGYKGDHAEVKPLYTTPPAAQRQWVGLTDQEIIEVLHPLVMADMSDEATDYEIARAIETKLKEKNT